MLIGISFGTIIYILIIIYPTPLIVWDKICSPKCEGSLGIRKTAYVNAAFLAKLEWKVLTDLITFGYKLFSLNILTNANFLRSRNWLQHPLCGTTFLLSLFIEEGLCWALGNVININIWHDMWMDESSLIDS